MPSKPAITTPTVAALLAVPEPVVMLVKKGFARHRRLLHRRHLRLHCLPTLLPEWGTVSCRLDSCTTTPAEFSGALCAMSTSVKQSATTTVDANVTLLVAMNIVERIAVLASTAT